MRFVYLDSRFTLHASSPRSVALTQLRFACLAVASLAGDLHPEECAHAGRTRKKGDVMITSPFITIDYTTASDRPQSLAQQRVVVSGRKSNERIVCSTTSAVLETD